MGTLPLSTIPFRGFNADPQEEIEQSEGRIEAIKKIVEYVDMPINNQLGVIVDKFLNPPKTENFDRDKKIAHNIFFRKALLNAVEEKRKVELKIRILCVLNKEVDWHFSEWKEFKEDFPNETENSFEKARDYGYYVLDAVREGRSIENILKIPYNKISQIVNCEEAERLGEIEQFVLDNNVGISYLRRMIEIVNEDSTVELNTAFEQAKKEAKEKREDKKAGTYEHKRYMKMRANYNFMSKILDYKESELEKSEYFRKIYQRRSEKYCALYKKLKEYIKQFKRFLKSKNIVFDSLENLPLQIFDFNKTIANSTS